MAMGQVATRVVAEPTNDVAVFQFSLGRIGLTPGIGACCGSLQGPVTQPSTIDVLDRILDKGIVIDAWVRISLMSVDLITLEARVVVASISTYLENTDALRTTLRLAPTFAFPVPEEVVLGIEQDLRELRRRRDREG